MTLEEKINQMDIPENLKKELKKQYWVEKDYWVRRAKMVEDLAGVGFAVESNSHDMMNALSVVRNGLDNVSYLIQEKIEDSEKKMLNQILKNAHYLADCILGKQFVFRSADYKVEVDIKEMVEKAVDVYRSSFIKEDIKIEVDCIESQLRVKMKPVVIIQTILNLLDNSFYELKGTEDKRIRIRIDGKKRQLLMMDSGSGILEEDKPYVFEPYFSKNGKRGMGLYLCKQLLEESGFSIYSFPVQLMSGAHFLIQL